MAAAPTQAITLNPAQQQNLGISSRPVVRVSEVESAPWMARVILTHEAEWVLTAPVAGVVVRILTEEGAPVVAGQSVMEITSPELPGWLAELASAEARLGFARSEYARDDQLHREGIIALRRKQASQLALTEATNAVAALRKRLQLLGVDADQAATGRVLIASEAAGHTLELLVRPGDRVDPAMPLVRLGRLEDASLEIALPLSVTAPAAGRELVGPKGLRARVNPTLPMVEEGVQQQLVKAQILASDVTLVPGTWVSVHALEPETQAWTIPREALVHDQGETWVFLIEGETFHVTPVTVRVVRGDEAVVLGDFNAGDEVVYHGISALIQLVNSSETP